MKSVKHHQIYGDYFSTNNYIHAHGCMQSMNKQNSL